MSAEELKERLKELHQKIEELGKLLATDYIDMEESDLIMAESMIRSIEFQMKVVHYSLKSKAGGVLHG